MRACPQFQTSFRAWPPSRRLLNTLFNSQKNRADRNGAGLAISPSRIDIRRQACFLRRYRVTVIWLPLSIGTYIIMGAGIIRRPVRERLCADPLLLLAHYCLNVHAHAKMDVLIYRCVNESGCCAQKREAAQRHPRVHIHIYDRFVVYVRTSHGRRLRGNICMHRSRRTSLT